MALKIVFCGTPGFALPTLRSLVAEPDFQVVGVVTQPDRPRGRGHEVSSSPVKEAALEAGISVYQPEKIKSESAHDYFKRVAPDVVVIIAYGQIIPATLIEMPRLGWINLHASLLPKYRGAAPINRAIVNGEKLTGLTTMRIDAGLDTGPMLLKHETTIGPDETAPQLTARLAEAGGSLMVETLRGLERGEITPTPQDNSRATHAQPLKKEDGRIDWSLSAQRIYNRIRGFDPWPGAYTTFRGKSCHIWGKPLKPIATFGEFGLILPPHEDGLLVISGDETVLRVDHVQLEGRKRITGLEFANGARIVPGEKFGA
ncbi:MAG: methionyl-tRNA formyltransferase [Candidatus Acidiferrales bacterium]